MSAEAGPIPLASQVGGHPGLLTTEDGSLVIKPCLLKENAFYQAINLDRRLSPLQGLTPDYLGTLKLHGNVQEGESAALDEEGLLALAQGDLNTGEGPIDVTEEEKEHIVLSNLTHPFTSPNVLDIKLGTVLYDSDASDEKKQRMIQTAKDTTSLETGIRLTGFQNWDSSTSKMVITPKAYGKSLSLSQLPSGIALFFPTTSPSSPSAPSSSPSQPAPTPGLPQPLLLIILQQILEQLQTIESALSKTEARFVGMSLLVIYEGDEEALRQALLNQPPPRMDDEDGSAEDDDDDDDDDDEEDEDSLESGDELDDDEMGVVTSSSRQRKKTTSSVVVKLIDFAHSRVVDKEGGEQGPDLGVLTGIGTIVELVEGRLGEVILMDSGSRSAGGPAREMA